MTVVQCCFWAVDDQCSSSIHLSLGRQCFDVWVNTSMQYARSHFGSSKHLSARHKFLLTKAGHNELQIDPQWLIYQMGLSYAYLGLLWPCEVFWYDFLSRSAAFSMNLMQFHDSFKIISLPSPIMESSTRSSLWIRYKQRRRMVAPHLCTMLVLRCSYIQPTRALAEHTLLGWELSTLRVDVWVSERLQREALGWLTRECWVGWGAEKKTKIMGVTAAAKGLGFSPYHLPLVAVIAANRQQIAANRQLITANRQLIGS